MNLPSPPTTVSTGHPSPPLSPKREHLSSASDDQDVVADYLDSMAFASSNNSIAWEGVSSLQYPPLESLNMNFGLPMTCAPDDILMALPTPVDCDYAYDFTFNNEDLSMMNMLPSPPSTMSPGLTSPSDPPSPIAGLPAGIDTSKLKLTFTTPPADPNNSSKKSPSSAQPKETKTKSSHTTIERRYRTNLNSRLISLRLAVPALRVLDKDPAGYEADDRGYVDGVKVAKKNSKAIVLGKAEEYILVLNRRTTRLKTELSALKSLFLSLLPPGEGAALLSQWEENHKATYGDERSDELPQSIEDDDDGDEPLEDEEDERPKKKPKKEKKEPSASSSAGAGAVVSSNGEVPVKRKRGRPRKNPLPVPPPAAADVAAPPTNTAPEVVIPPPPHHPTFAAPVQPIQQQQQQQPQAQYLLAAFAFFSLFGSSSTPAPSSSPHTTSGQVLTPVLLNSSSLAPKSWMGYVLSPELLRAVQLITSLLLLVSLLAPYASRLGWREKKEEGEVEAPKKESGESDKQKRAAIRYFVDTVHGRPSTAVVVVPTDDEQVQNILKARELYVSLFPQRSAAAGGMMITPPPSPKVVGMTKSTQHALRVLLAESVFELDDEVEEARDLVVGLLEG